MALASTAVAAQAGCAAAGRTPASLGGTQFSGPALGHVSEGGAAVWGRLDGIHGPQELYLALEAAPGDVHWLAGTCDPNRDGCVVWRVDGLRPATEYRYRVARSPRRNADEPGWYSLRTAPPPDVSARATIAMGSCAHEDEGSASVWRCIEANAPDALVLLGDTPYIDSTDLAMQRRRHREFLSQPALAHLIAHTPLYAVWDDHDFGGNDSDGNLPGKDRSRQAFIEYHAPPSAGDGQGGVYTSFRWGPIEVFLLDTRYYANTGPSPADPRKPTLLGREQWDWLTSRLAASTAPFKVLASGIIWNGAVRFMKTDHWETWRHERDALLALAGDLGIGGVVLVGGDIHRSRVIRHATAGLAGYDILELITSPIHGDVMTASGAPHPGLLADIAEPNTFLLLTADTTVSPARLEARFLNAAGATLFETTLTADELH